MTRQRRHLGILTLTTAVAFCLGSTTLVRAQTDLPSAETLLDKSLEAIGGKEAVLKLKNRSTTGKFDMAAMGISGSMTTYSAAPNMSVETVELTGMGTIREGSTGKIAWENSMMTGPRVKEGEEAVVSLRNASFHKDVYWRKHYSEVKTVAKETIEDKECYKVEMTPKIGHKEIVFLDASSYLPVKLVMTIKNPMAEIESDVFPSDYKAVDGVLLPHKIRVSMMGGMQTYTITMDTVTHNVELPEGCFDLPEEVQALVKKTEAEPVQ